MHKYLEEEDERQEGVPRGDEAGAEACDMRDI
jgi:hypothetical protein